MGQERLGPSYFFIPLVLGPLNSLLWYVPSLSYTRGLGWLMHCGAEVTESSNNKHHHLSTLQPYSHAGCVVVPQIGQNSTNWIGKACRKLKPRNAVSILTWQRRLGIERFPIQTSFGLAADGLYCALPRVTHFGLVRDDVVYWYLIQ